MPPVDMNRTVDRSGRPRVHVVNWLAMLTGVIVITAFAVVAIRSDLNAQSIRRGQTNDHQIQVRLCIIINQNTVNTNTLIDSLITAVNATTSLPTTEKARRIKTYQESKGTLAECGK